MKHWFLSFSVAMSILRRSAELRPVASTTTKSPRRVHPLSASVSAESVASVASPLVKRAASASMIATADTTLPIKRMRKDGYDSE